MREAYISYAMRPFDTDKKGAMSYSASIRNLL